MPLKLCIVKIAILKQYIKRWKHANANNANLNSQFRMMI